MRIVLDTNIWVSAAFWRRGKPRRLVDLLGESKPTPIILMDSWLLGEIFQTFEQIRHRYRLSELEVTVAIEQIKKRATWVTVTSRVTGSRDVSDNPILALAKDGRAEYLITGDKDLLVLKRIGKTKITKPAQFLAMLSST
ncbi:putative toxin-antitoxin system toxin component, PIN family [Candidatus Berkelbacteria bacterium]|nr:putative toxin-antitoxin system toxin component, PIN family [Candidatus Berkelbacteria bacterium]